MRLSNHLFYYRGGEKLPLWGGCSGNSYMIRGVESALTDPGPSVGKHLWRMLDEINRDGLIYSDISAVILTHAHPDHATGLAGFIRRTGATPYAHKLEARVLREPGLQVTDEFDAAGKYIKLLSSISPKMTSNIYHLMFGPAAPVKDIKTIKQDDTLHLGGHCRLSIVELPGHRPGEIGIHIPEDNALVTGDLINFQRYDLPSLNMPLSDLGAAEDSLKKILALDLEILAPSHDVAVAGRDKVRRWVEDSIARCRSLRETARREISGNPAVSLFALGKKLAGKNEGVPPYEFKFLAFAVLKSFSDGIAFLDSKL